MSALGVKRTWLLRCTCLLLTQSGHDPFQNAGLKNPVRCPVLILGGGNEAARVHRAVRRRGATWPLAARAQQPERVRRIGVLMSFGDPTRSLT